MLGPIAAVALALAATQTVVAAGDIASCGSRGDEATAALRGRKRPQLGAYATSGASGYFAYFGRRAGEPAEGYYSFDLRGGWHVVSLNSNCAAVGGCEAGSPQERWLRADLAAHPARCIRLSGRRRPLQRPRRRPLSLEPQRRMISDSPRRRLCRRRSQSPRIPTGRKSRWCAVRRAGFSDVMGAAAPGRARTPPSPPG